MPFGERFMADLENAKQSIVIVSPYVTVRRVYWLRDVFTNCIKKGTGIIVYTRPSNCFQGKAMQAADAAISTLESLGVMVHCREGIHQKYAVMDEKIVWYGSINLLSFGASQESIMRLNSGCVARALQME